MAAAARSSLAASRIANPQMTRPSERLSELDASRLRAIPSVVADEGRGSTRALPERGYAQLAASGDAVLSISLKGFARGPKDMLDAYVAAWTVRECVAGRGTSVGGGDGLGEIILPRPLRGPATAVLKWPAGRFTATVMHVENGKE